MAKKAGICRNIDCDNYKQVIEVEAGEEFECPLCHQPLEDSGSGGSKEGKKKRGQGGGPNLKLIGIIVGALLLLGGAGFGTYMLLNKKTSIPTAIKLDNKKLTMKVGETAVIVPTAEPEGIKATFTFKRKKEKIVEVNNGGEVKALKKGETSILVKCEENPELRAICKITVIEDTTSVVTGGGEDSTKTNPEPPDTLIQNIIVDKPSIVMNVGESAEVAIAIEPENYNEDILVSSSNDNVAEFVTNERKIVAKNAGTAVITLKGEKSGVVASIKVTVKKPQSPPPPDDNPRRVKLSYGTYNGETIVIGGKRVPHGHGTVTFTTTHRIVSSQDYIAQPGDRYEGEWRNGVIAGGLGYWYHDGNTTGIRP